MTRDEALAILTVRVEAGAAPTLTSNELGQLIDAAKVTDDTWDVNAAAAEGWMLKAGKAAAEVDVADEAAQVKLSQRRAGFIAMAKEWRARADADAVAGGGDYRPLASFTEQPFEPLPRESSHFDWTSP